MSNNFADKLQAVNDRLSYYEIVITDKVLAEDGKYYEAEGIGYALRNKETGIIEHTTMVLPGIIFQAESLDSMLDDLLTPPKDVAVDSSGGDVVPMPH